MRVSVRRRIKHNTYYREHIVMQLTPPEGGPCCGGRCGASNARSAASTDLCFSICPTSTPASTPERPPRGGATRAAAALGSSPSMPSPFANRYTACG